MRADDIVPTHGQQERSDIDDAHRQQLQAGSSIHEAESLPFKSQNRDVTPGDGLVSTAQRLEEVNVKRG